MQGGGLLAAAAMIWVAPAVNLENSLILLQLLAGFGWGLAFAGLMSFASAAGSRGAEGLFMGSFFAMTAVAAFRPARSVCSQANCTRMKNRPVTGSLYCAASSILPPCSSKNPETACTRPSRSGQDKVKI